MRALKIIGYILILGLTFYFNSYYWAHELPKVLYEGQPVPLEAVNDHTYQGISLIFLVFIFIYALVGRYFTTLFITNGMMFLFYFANKTKYMERGELVNFNELKLIFKLRELNNLVDLKIILISMFFSIFIIIILYFVESKIYKKLKMPKLKIMRIVLVIFVISSALFIYKDSEKFAYNYFGIEKPDSFIFNTEKELKRIGVLPNFIINMSREYMIKPEKYSLNTISTIENKYLTLSKEYNHFKKYDILNEKTLIYLSESFWQDESLIENDLPASLISELEEEWGGKMKSLFIGGGTANIEFEVLTSTSLELHENPMVTTPYVDYFGKNDKTSSFLTLVNDNIVIHPYHFNLYRRLNVYDDMNISHLVSEVDMNEAVRVNNRISDEFLNTEIEKYLKDFSIFNILSMQNHSLYNKDILIDEIDYHPQYTKNIFYTDSEDEDKVEYIEKANSFFRQLVRTDEAIKELLLSFEEKKENVNLIFYGDHGPNFLRNKEDELGDSIYYTPYFIYQNHNKNSKISTKKLNPMFLIPKLLSDGDYKVTPYYYLLVQMYQKEVTGITNTGAYINGSYKEDKDIDSDVLELINDYRIITYNRYFDKKGLTEDFFEKQY